MATVYADHFGSVERRRAQAERDQREAETPIRPIYSGSAPGSALALEPQVEAPPKTAAEREARWLRKQLRKGRMNKAQMRRAIASAGDASSPASR